LISMGPPSSGGSDNNHYVATDENSERSGSRIKPARGVEMVHLQLKLEAAASGLFSTQGRKKTKTEAVSLTKKGPSRSSTTKNSMRRRRCTTSENYKERSKGARKAQTETSLRANCRELSDDEIMSEFSEHTDSVSSFGTALGVAKAAGDDVEEEDYARHHNKTAQVTESRASQKPLGPQSGKGSNAVISLFTACTAQQEQRKGEQKPSPPSGRAAAPPKKNKRRRVTQSVDQATKKTKNASGATSSGKSKSRQTTLSGWFSNSSGGSGKTK